MKRVRPVPLSCIIWKLNMNHKTILALTLLLMLSTNSSAQNAIPKFRAETIDSKVVIGYGTAIGDVDGDGKPDILLADKQQFVWYQNPTWKRHVIAEKLTERDNVCIAARDIDGDGKVEIAVGGQWNPNDTEKSGSIHYLVAPDDRTKKWEPVRLEHEPVVHRMRWVQTAQGKFALVVAPLHGRGNKGGEGKGARLLAYHKPDNPKAAWKTDLLDDTMHVTHNFDVAKWEENNQSETVFYLGKEGAKSIRFDGKKWQSIAHENIQGGGEIRLGSLNIGGKFVATIEPFHGTHLAVYVSEKSTEFGFGKRIVLDDSFNQGHAIAVGDLFGNGSQQIVAGWRKRNSDGKFGIKLFYPANTKTDKWNSSWVDENEMACEDLRIGDLNGDGRPEIVASGRSTHNLKIYWNEKQ